MEFSTEQLAIGLRNITPGYLPESLFFEISRLGVLTAIEVVPVRMVGGTCEVLLTQRPSTDLYWPNLWHNPGTIVRPTDEPGSFTSAFIRVCEGELGFTDWVTPKFVNSFFWHSSRGGIVSLVHWLDVGTYSSFTTGVFYSAHNLPQDLIAGMQPMIAMAVKNFKVSKGL
jgi:hypothetical protein